MLIWFAIIHVITTLITFATALPSTTEKSISRCGSVLGSDKMAEVEQKMKKFVGPTSLSGGAVANISKDWPFSVNVPVHWHVIVGDGLLAGDISHTNQLKDTVNGLNTDFKPTGFSFSLNSVDVSVNNTWFNAAMCNRSIEFEMKRCLRVGDITHLNIYTVNGGVNKTLGLSHFPWDAQRRPILDGVMILYTTLKGGSLQNYNLGKTLTHETGHWLGLLHTFGNTDNGCIGDGDFVADTPAQRSATLGCPKTIPDSCPDLPGLDPIHNYMDYSNDGCMREFTSGQVSRMQQSWQFRLPP